MEASWLDSGAPIEAQTLEDEGVHHQRMATDPATYQGPLDDLKARAGYIQQDEVALGPDTPNLDAICATPGLDAVYIGPADLSFALDLEPRGDNPDPVHIATCDKIRESAHRHGIKAVMHCASAAFAAGAVKRGFDMVMLTSDLASMIAGARRQLDDLKADTA